MTSTGTTSRLYIAAICPEKGALSVSLTVSGSGVSMSEMPVNCPRAQAAVSSAWMRSIVYFTSSLVISRPLWNSTPGRRWKM